MFYLASEELSPRQLGQCASAAASQSAPDMVKCMVDGKEHRSDSIFERIKLRPRIAVLEIFALHVAAFYVHAQLLLKSPPNRMAEVYSGIRADVESWLKAGPELIEYFDSAFRTYVLVLDSELRSPLPDDIGFNMDYGPTVKLAAEQVITLYTVYPEFNGRKLDIDQLDAIFLQISIKTSLTTLLSTLQQQLTYKGDTVAPTPANAASRVESPATMAGAASAIGRTSLPANDPPGYKPMTFGNKLFLSAFAIIILLGLMKLIFRY